MSNLHYPEISCIVIGLNCEQTICSCIESIRKSDYPRIIEIIYVDGGSKDKSVSIARSTEDVRVIELNLKFPTPGRGRNAGWHEARAEWIHFFDSDTMVEKGWIAEAVKHIDSKTGAVFGWRKEKEPLKNCFHLVGDLEWMKPEMAARFFGGDVLIRKSSLQETGGYDETLIAGEDPELSVRIRRGKWQIKGIDALMCYHDLRMSEFKKYFIRATRTGYAFVEAGLKMLKFGEKIFILKAAKIVIKIVLVLTFIITAWILNSFTLGIFALVVVFLPIVRTGYFKRQLNINYKKAFIYSIHCSVVIWPMFFGILNFLITTFKIKFFKKNA